YAPGFIEKSLKILESRPHCLQVQLRAPNDLNGHPLDVHGELVADIPIKTLSLDYKVEGSDGIYNWHGFSFNPGLRRLSDYKRIGGYSVHTRISELRTEEAIGICFRNLGFHTVVLCDNGSKGYVRHIGEHRHVAELWGARAKRRIKKMVQHTFG